MSRYLTLLTVFALLASACTAGSDDVELVGIRASTDIAVGDSRFLFAVNEIGGARRGSPDEAVSLIARPLDRPGSTHEVDAEFVWIVPDSIGLYLADLPFDSAGNWEIDFSISTGEKTQPFLVFVQEEPVTVALGEQAPLVATPTIESTPVEDLTTDHPVLESLYELSLDEALANGNKTVAIFATPAFCTSAACGPLMRQAKDISQAYPSVNWLHIEVYEGFNDADFAPDSDHLVEAVVEFGLPSEPWIFVMDEQGVVVSRLEGVLAPGELEAILDS